jgi:hypothetical protein
MFTAIVSMIIIVLFALCCDWVMQGYNDMKKENKATQSKPGDDKRKI